MSSPTGKRRKIITRHLLRRTAYESEHRLGKLQAVASIPGAVGQEAAKAELGRLGLSQLAALKVERAGRIRARWVVVSEW